MEPGVRLAGASGREIFDFPLLARGFRPFFLLAAAWACVLTAAWLAVLTGRLPAPGPLDPIVWHGHEMLFGFVVAAVAGFLLTSVPVWTNTPPVRGGALAALVALWLAGRIAMALGGRLPTPLVAAVDVAFLPALAAAVARPIARTRARRNFGIAAVALLLVAANVGYHLAATGVVAAAARPALRFGIDLVIVLVVVIGGRITPLFTDNALRRAGSPVRVGTSATWNRLAIAGAGAVAASDLLLAPGAATGAIALFAALAVAARMTGWRTRHVLCDPLLLSLHAGLLWVVVGFAAAGLADLGVGVPRTAALHALTAGAMGSMILAVMTRVALGHTGRPLRAPPSAVVAYGLVHAGALARVAGPVLAPHALLPVWTLAGVLWSGAFAAFLAGYGAILVRARVDARPG